MDKPILLETSARHVHVSREALETLFGPGYELTKKRISPSLGNLPVRSVSPLSALRGSFLRYPSSGRFAVRYRWSSPPRMRGPSV